MVSTTSSVTVSARATSPHRRPLLSVSVSRTAAVIRSTHSSAPRHLPAVGSTHQSLVVPLCSWLLTLLMPSTATCSMSTAVSSPTSASSRSKAFPSRAKHPLSGEIYHSLHRFRPNYLFLSSFFCICVDSNIYVAKMVKES